MKHAKQRGKSNPIVQVHAHDSGSGRNSTSFWQRFVYTTNGGRNGRRLTRISDFALPEVMQNLTQHKHCAADVLACIQLVNAQPGSHAGPSSFRTCFTNMQQLAQNDAASIVAQIVYKIYFWIVTCEKPNEYIVEAQAERSSKAKQGVIDGLWTEYGDTQACISYREFDQKVRDWRKQGCRYVWLASRLNLGSLLHLHGTIGGARDAFTRGGEKAGGKDKASEVALAHLQKIDLCQAAVESGADEMMQSMLWLVCEGIKGFDKEKEKRGGGQGVKFVGFE